MPKAERATRHQQRRSCIFGAAFPRYGPIRESVWALETATRDRSCNSGGLRSLVSPSCLWTPACCCSCFRCRWTHSLAVDQQGRQWARAIVADSGRQTDLVGRRKWREQMRNKIGLSNCSCACNWLTVAGFLIHLHRYVGPRHRVRTSRCGSHRAAQQ